MGVSDPQFRVLAQQVENLYGVLGLSNKAVFAGLSEVNPEAHRDPENEQTVPLPANGVWTASKWHDMRNMHNTIVFWASDAEPLAVVVEWSDDGINTGVSGFDVTPLTVTPLTSGGFTYWIVFSAQTIAIQNFMRVSVLNGPAPQGFVTAFTACTKGPFTGTYGGLNESLSPVSLAALHRAVIAGQQPDGTFTNVPLSASGKLLTETPEELNTLSALLGAVAKDSTLTAVGAVLTALNGRDFATQATLAALLAKLETGLAKDASLTGGALRGQIDIRRLSQVAGRTYITRIVDAVSVLTTLHTVTAGKTFYLTSLIFTVSSTAALLTTCNIRDAGTVKIPLSLPASGKNDPNINGALSFPEPVRFSTSVVVAPNLPTVTASITVVGYEE